MTDERKLQISLFGLRLGVFAVMFVWAINRVTNYAHNSKVMSHYYKLDLSENMLTVLGIVQILILLCFLIGKFKALSYGFVLLTHLGATLASAYWLIPPYERHELLYFGSLPMLAACLALFLLREKDTFLTWR